MVEVVGRRKSHYSYFILTTLGICVDIHVYIDKTTASLINSILFGGWTLAFLIIFIFPIIVGL